MAIAYDANDGEGSWTLYVEGKQVGQVKNFYHPTPVDYSRGGDFTLGSTVRPLSAARRGRRALSATDQAGRGARRKRFRLDVFVKIAAAPRGGTWGVTVSRREFRLAGKGWN